MSKRFTQTHTDYNKTVADIPIGVQWEYPKMRASKLPGEPFTFGLHSVAQIVCMHGPWYDQWIVTFRKDGGLARVASELYGVGGKQAACLRTTVEKLIVLGADVDTIMFTEPVE